MVRFLSPEWIEALDRRARDADVARDGSTIVVEQSVTEYGAEPITYQLVVGDDAARVVAGAPLEPAVTLRTDRATATAIARGELSAQQAFIEGRLRVGGDARALVRHATMLAQLDRSFTALRDETTFDDA